MHVSSGFILFRKLRQGKFSLSVPGLGLNEQNTSCQSICSAGPFLQPLNREGGREGAAATSSLPGGAARPEWGLAGRGGLLLPGIPSLSCRARAGATQAPNGFQAPTLKGGGGEEWGSEGLWTGLLPFFLQAQVP